MPLSSASLFVLVMSLMVLATKPAAFSSCFLFRFAIGTLSHSVFNADDRCTGLLGAGASGNAKSGMQSSGTSTCSREGPAIANALICRSCARPSLLLATSSVASFLTLIIRPDFLATRANTLGCAPALAVALITTGFAACAVSRFVSSLCSFAAAVSLLDISCLPTPTICTFRSFSNDALNKPTATNNKSPAAIPNHFRLLKK